MLIKIYWWNSCLSIISFLYWQNVTCKIERHQFWIPKCYFPNLSFKVAHFVPIYTLISRICSCLLILLVTRWFVSFKQISNTLNRINPPIIASFISYSLSVWWFWFMDGGELSCLVKLLVVQRFVDKWARSWHYPTCSRDIKLIL